MYSNNKKKITGLGKEREESIFLCCLFKCGTHLWSDISGSVTSCPFSWKDDHSPECTWTTLAKEKEREREAEAWSQGLRRAARTPVSAAGSHLTSHLLLRLNLRHFRPPEQQFQPEASARSRCRLKGTGPASQTPLAQNQTKTPAEVTVE